MIVSPLIGTPDHAELASAVSWTNPDAPDAERVRDQRVLHVEPIRTAGGSVSIWRGYAARHRVTNRLLKNVWPSAR